jgi:hypothetical protein
MFEVWCSCLEERRDESVERENSGAGFHFTCRSAAQKVVRFRAIPLVKGVEGYPVQL